MMTPEELALFKTDILGNTDGFVIEELAGGGRAGVAVWYNELAEPPFIVWKTSLPTGDIMNAITFSGTGGLIARTSGELSALSILLERTALNVSLANIRQALVDIFSGPGAAAVATRNALSSLSKRQATRAEKLFASGTGSDVSPANVVFEGMVTSDDVSYALAS